MEHQTRATHECRSAVVVLRNYLKLLIYLHRELQERVFEIFHYALCPNGYPFLGSAETVESSLGLFESQNQLLRIHRRSEQHSALPVLPSLPLLPR